MNNSSDSRFNELRLFIYLLIFMVIAVRGFMWRWSLRKPTPGLNASSDSDSEIISFYAAGHDLANVKRGELNGMRYSMYASMPEGFNQAGAFNPLAISSRRHRSENYANQMAFTNTFSAIFALDLPFNTQTHLLGLSTQHKIDRLQFENFLRVNGMTKVVLEGDFRDYFDIYAAPGQDVVVREVLNPKSMGFVVDYCRSHFWEINGSTLYIVATEADKGNDNIITESQQFVTEIKPALLPGDPGAPVVHHDNPYGEYDGPPLPCPICQKTMTQTDNWFSCSDGHGVLLSGADLERFHEHSLAVTADPTKSQQHGALTCPNDHSPMQPVNYEETGAIINTCPTCPYRWLDAAAIAKLNSTPLQPVANPLEN